jgi:FkbM family methyltransferase
VTRDVGSNIGTTVILDVGSNIGTTVLGFLDTNPRCTVVSFEAQSYLAQLQKKTMIINNVTHRVKVYNNAIGHACIPNITLSGTFCQIDSLEEKNASINYTDNRVRNFGGLSIGEGGETVDMLTIDSLGLPKVDVIKADVEGAEPLVIYGARNTIAKHKPIIVYEKNWKCITPEMAKTLGLSDTLKFFDIQKFLLSLGYNQSKLKVIDDNYIWEY